MLADGGAGNKIVPIMRFCTPGLRLIRCSRPQESLVTRPCPSCFFLCLVVSWAAVAADVLKARVTGPEATERCILMGSTPGAALLITSTYFTFALKFPGFQHACCPRRMTHLSSRGLGRNWADWSRRLFSDSKEWTSLSNWNCLPCQPHSTSALPSPAVYYTGVCGFCCI